MQWLVRKVVKWILQAILESEEFDAVVRKVSASAVSSGGSAVKQVVRETLSSSASMDDGIDSSKALADAIIGGTKRIEMSGTSGEEVVVPKKKRKGKTVLDILNKIDS